MSVWHWCHWKKENLPQKSYYIIQFFKLFWRKRLSLFIWSYWSQALTHLPGLGAQTSQPCLCELSCITLGIHTQAERRQFWFLIRPHGPLLWESADVQLSRHETLTLSSLILASITETMIGQTLFPTWSQGRRIVFNTGLQFPITNQ